MDQIDTRGITQGTLKARVPWITEKEVPSEDNPEIVIRVVRIPVVDVHAVRIEVADVDEVTVRAVLLTPVRDTGDRGLPPAKQKTLGYILFPLNLIRPQSSWETIPSLRMSKKFLHI